MVFDECHHARKNSPYRQIMKLFYEQCDIDVRPKIFGMTASPSFAKMDSRDAIRFVQVGSYLCGFV
jgi:endoribonuclease Dicer